MPDTSVGNSLAIFLFIWLFRLGHGYFHGMSSHFIRIGRESTSKYPDDGTLFRVGTVPKTFNHVMAEAPSVSIGTCPAGISSQISRQPTKLKTDKTRRIRAIRPFILVKSVAAFLWSFSHFHRAPKVRLFYRRQPVRSDLEATKSPCRLREIFRQSNDTGSSRRPLG
jgi:hypothetical protein